MKNIVWFIFGLVVLSVVFLKGNFFSQPIEPLSGTVWYYSLQDRNSKVITRSLGYRFIDQTQVEMLDGDSSLGLASYAIEGNKLVVTHSCGKDVLVRQGDDLVRLGGANILTALLHFRKVNQ